jgi:hypothetical protein
MICTNCGNNVSNGQFCETCGQAVANNAGAVGQQYAGGQQQYASEQQFAAPQQFQNALKKNNSKALAAMILGLCSIVGWFIPLFGYPLTVLAIIFGVIGLKSEKKGQAVAGLILGAVFLIFTLVNSILGALIMTNLMG